MTLEQHIEELRAELRHCTREEQLKIEHELKAARNEFARLLADEPL